MSKNSKSFGQIGFPATYSLTLEKCEFSMKFASGVAMFTSHPLAASLASGWELCLPPPLRNSTAVKMFYPFFVSTSIRGDGKGIKFRNLLLLSCVLVLLTLLCNDICHKCYFQICSFLTLAFFVGRTRMGRICFIFVRILSRREYFCPLFEIQEDSSSSPFIPSFLLGICCVRDLNEKGGCVLLLLLP